MKQLNNLFKMRKIVILSAFLSVLLPVSSCRKENPNKLTGISIDPEKVEIAVGKTSILSVLAVPDNARIRDVQWSSSNPNLVTVSEDGVLTASPINQGNAVITARCGDKEAYCDVRVVVPVQMFGFYESIQSKSMSVGEEFSWGVVYMPVAATDHDIVFENSDPSVAELTQDAHDPTQFKVKAKKLGNTTITAKCGGKETKMLICVDEVKATKVTITPASVALTPLDTKQLTATVEPSDATNKNLLWFSMIPEIATVDENGLVTANRTGTVTIAAYCGDAYAFCEVSVTVDLPDNAVDLGLSVFWATTNFGKDGFCSSPEEPGAYYAWGETSTKSNYEWKTYKYCKSGRSSYDVELKKYNTSPSYGDYVDGLTELEREDDVVRARLNSYWRMPTVYEFQELIENCTSTWTTLNGMNGVKLTSNKPGFKDRWIFLPAASCMVGDELFSYPDFPAYGKTGRYWTSSLAKREPDYAWNAFVSEEGVSLMKNPRCVGYLIRPVCR